MITMASLTQIAKKAGVSVTAASLVLNKKDHGTRVSGECAKRIRVIAKELGYVANYHASSIKRGSSETVALALDLGDISPDNRVTEPSQLATPYLGLMIGGVEEYMRQRGYLLTIVGPQAKMRAPDRGLLGIRQRRFDGMIMLGTLIHLDETTILQDAPDYPIVVVEPPVPTALPTVDYDEWNAVGLAVEHLASLGHKELLWVGEPPMEALHQRPMRHKLFAQWCRKLGLRHDVLFLSEQRRRYHDVPDAAHAVMSRYLGDKPRTFTGIVAYNDNTAVGVLEALNDAGLRVPQDVSLVGHDDYEARRCRPKLTSVDHRLDDMGRAAGEMLLRMQADPGLVKKLRNKPEMIAPRLSVRGSTAAARRE